MDTSTPDDEIGSKIERLGAIDADGSLVDNLGILSTELIQATRDAYWYYTRSEAAYASRLNIWNGQSDDGRKHGSDLNANPFPWEGASDTRTRIIDAAINEQVMLMMQAFTRAKPQAVAVDSQDMVYSEKVSKLLQYVIWNQMRPQIRRELQLAANWRQTYGASVTSIMWDQQLRRTVQEITIPGLAAMMAQSDDPQVVTQAQQKVMETIMDPLREEECFRELMQLSPILKKSMARKCLQELRQTGKTEIPVPEVFAAMPRWQALLPMVDIFFPAITDDIQRAPWVAHRERITESELRDRINTQGYDPDWVEAAVKKKGYIVDTLTSNLLLLSESRRNFWGILDWERRDLIEIFHFRRKSIDDDGLPQVWNTVMCLAVKDMVGLDEPLPYEHGQYPYVVHQRENIARVILESRGVPTVTYTMENEIKVQRDARTDRTSISVLPPLLVPPSRGATNLTFGPGTKWPQRRGEEISWLPIPPADNSSIEVEKAAQATFDTYVGRMTQLCPPQIAQLHQQDLIDGWLIEMRMVVQQTLQLMMQYMDPAMVEKVIGQLPDGWQDDQKTIQGMFDIMLEFDSRDLNQELLQEKMQLLQGALALDRFGQTDFSKLFPMLFSAIDPNLAGAVLQPVGQATQAQIEDEKAQLAKMVAGIEPDMQPMPGQNYQLRKQVLGQSIQTNPELAQMIQARPVLQKMVENRLKFFDFQLQQQNNAVIGRVGTQPLLNQPGEQLPGGQTGMGPNQ
jgi:hypothetical protein